MLLILYVMVTIHLPLMSLYPKAYGRRYNAVRVLELSIILCC
jgi:hypothetical protein